MMDEQMAGKPIKPGSSAWDRKRMEMLRRKKMVLFIEERKGEPYCQTYSQTCESLSNEWFTMTLLKFERWRQSIAEWEEKYPNTLKMETPAGSNQRGVSASPPQAVDHATSTSLPASRPSPQKAS